VPLRDAADRLAESPLLFHYLRKLPELNYRATKARIAAVRDALGSPRVLDAGCGTGEFAHLFDASTYVGVDVCEPYVRFARRRSPGRRFECADLASWKWDGPPFDLVLVNGVLHHLDDATALGVLRGSAALGRPGATVLVIEDVDRHGAGLGTRLVHSLDHGHFIRSSTSWEALVSRVVAVERSESYASGLCPYHLMLGTKR
jgi:SAM-dependent methyltransferase